MVRKCLFLLASALLFLSLLLLPVCGLAPERVAAAPTGTEGAGADTEETSAQLTFPDEGLAALEDFRATLPPEVVALLPEDFFSSDPVRVADAVQETGSVSSVLAMSRELLGSALQESATLLVTLAGILVLSAVLHALSASLAGGSGRAFSFCTVLATALLILQSSLSDLPRIRVYFQSVQTLSAALIPLMGTLYALGGNVRAAVANHAVLTAFLSVAETLCSRTVLPVAGACLALSLPDALTGRASLRGLCTLIKRTFVLGLSLLMLLLSFLLGLQTTLAAGADSLALRTARFAAGSFLPVIGSSVSEALRTVFGSVGYLRTLAGSGGILVLLLLFLPMLLRLLVRRTVLLLAGALAELLGATGEGRILSELASVYGFFLAVSAAIFVMSVFALTLFAHCATAGG